MDLEFPDFSDYLTRNHESLSLLHVFIFFTLHKAINQVKKRLNDICRNEVNLTFGKLKRFLFGIRRRVKVYRKLGLVKSRSFPRYVEDNPLML